MAEKGKKSQPEPSGLAGELGKLSGRESGLDVAALDGVLLWYAVMGLAKRGASLQVGVTKDGGSWATQVWEGQFPLKDYFGDTPSFNRHLAALVRVCWKKDVSADIEERIQSYGY